MPTSYTAPLYEGEDITFEQFALRAARAMGPTILLRDSPIDVEPTEQNVLGSDYEETRLTELLAERERYREMGDEEAADDWQESFVAATRYLADFRAKRESLRERYDEMVERVEAWTPPTDDHVALKDFMLSQLRESIEFDTGGSYEPELPTPVTGAEHRAAKIDRLDREVERARASVAESAERNQWRQKWVRDLRESLSGVAV